MKITLKDGSTLKVEGFQASVVAKDAKQNITLDGGVLRGIQDGILDADGGVFFQRQLEYIKAQSYDVQYADLKARELFPVSNEAGDGINTITYRTYDMVGMAKIINAYADDLPRADVGGKEVSVPVRTIGNSYGYSIDEIRASQLVGAGLDVRRADAAKRAQEQLVNDVAFFGDAASGLPGLFTHPNIPTGDVVDGGSGTEWVNKTPDQILFDINDLFADVYETSLMKEKANTLLLPVSQWSYIMSTPRSSNSDTTIAQFIVNNSPYLSSINDIVPVNELAAANNPELSSDAMVAYDKNPMKLQLEIPVEFEQMATQQRNLEFIVPCRSRLGGLNIYYPLSIAIATGI